MYRWLGGSARARLPHAFGDPRRLTRTLHWHYLQPLSSRRAREGKYALACALRGSDAHYDSLWQRRDILATLPLTLIWGKRDPVLTRVHRDRWLQAFPAARRISVAAAGHFVAEERPDVIIAALRDFPGDSPQEAACRTAREDPTGPACSRIACGDRRKSHPLRSATMNCTR